MKRWMACLLGLLLCMSAFCACKEDVPEQKGEPYSFAVDGIAFTPGGDAGAPLAAWKGAAPQISVKGSCLDGVDGEDVTYVFTDFRIQTFRTGASEVIRWVILQSDAVKTGKGIAIGDSAEQMKTAYGQPTEETASLSVYESGGTRLRFTHRDGVITKIEYTVSE